MDIAMWLSGSLKTATLLIIQSLFWLLIFYIGCRIGAKAITKSILEETTKPK